MFTQNDITAHLEHHKELLHEFEQERFALAVDRAAKNKKKVKVYKKFQPKPTEALYCNCNSAEITCCAA